MSTLDVRPAGFNLLLPPGGATIEVVAGEGQLADTSLAMWLQERALAVPDVEQAVATATLDDSDIGEDRVSFTLADLSELDQGEFYRVIIADGDEPWCNGLARVSNDGTAAQATTLTVTVASGSITLDITAGPGGTGIASGLPAGTAGQMFRIAQDGETVEAVTPNTAEGPVRTDEDNTIPDILLPASIARDSEVDAAAAAALDAALAADPKSLGFLHLTNLDVSSPHPFGGFLPPSTLLIELAGQTNAAENGTYWTPEDPATEVLVKADAGDQLLQAGNSGRLVTFAITVAGASIRSGAHQFQVYVSSVEGVRIALQYGGLAFAQVRYTGDPAAAATIAGASFGNTVLVTDQTDNLIDGGLYIYMGDGQVMARSGVFAPEGSRVFVMSEDVDYTLTPHSGWIPSSLVGRVDDLELDQLIRQNAELIQPDAWFVLDEADNGTAWSSADLPEIVGVPDFRALVMFQPGDEDFAEILTRTSDSGLGGEDSPEFYLRPPSGENPTRVGLEYVGSGDSTDETSVDVDCDIAGFWAWVRVYPDLAPGGGIAQVAVPSGGDTTTADGRQWLTLPLDPGTVPGFAGSAGIDYQLTEPWWLGLRFNGRIARAEIRDGVDGTLVAAPDASDWGSGTSFTDSEGNVWSTTTGIVRSVANAKIINTDGNPGTTIYVGTVDPVTLYDLEVGDVWIPQP